MDLPNLNGYTVVLTGASSGIGRAAALEFARQRANLVLAARHEPSLRALAAQCEAFGAQTLVVPTDVARWQAVKVLARAAAARFGGIDVWVNSAGVSAFGAFVETPVEAHSRVIEVNLLGCINGAHAVLPYFLGQRSGVLINLVSAGAWVPAPYVASYTASKLALQGLTAALRTELHATPAVRICDVYPGFADTPGLGHAGNYAGRRLRPVGPLVDPVSVARRIVALVRAPRDRVVIGLTARVGLLARLLCPGLAAWGAAWAMRAYLRHAESAPRGHGNLFAPSVGYGVHGGLGSAKPACGSARPWQPWRDGAGLLAGVLALAWLARRVSMAGGAGRR